MGEILEQKLRHRVTSADPDSRNQCQHDGDSRWHVHAEMMLAATVALGEREVLLARIQAALPAELGCVAVQYQSIPESVFEE